MNHTPSLFVANPKEAARRLRVYPALVAACQAACDLDILQDAFETDDRENMHEVMERYGLASIDPEDALHELRAQVSILLRDALAAAGEGEPGIRAPEDGDLDDIALYDAQIERSQTEPQAMSDLLDPLDGTIREQV